MAENDQNWQSLKAVGEEIDLEKLLKSYTRLEFTY